MKPAEPLPLRVQRDELSRRLAERLAEQAPLNELQAVRARLQLLDEAIAASTPPPPAWRHHLAALALVAGLVSIAALWPMPRTSFALTLETNSAQLQMAQAGTLEGDIVDRELRAEGFARLESADGSLGVWAAERLSPRAEVEQAQDGGARSRGTVPRRRPAAAASSFMSRACATHHPEPARLC